MIVKGLLFALAAFGLYATHDVVVKVLGGSYSPVQIVFFSTLMSFPLVTFMLMQDRTQGNLVPVRPFWTLLRSASATLAMSSAFYAFSVLPLAQTYAILFAMPLLITLLAIPILGERVGLHRGVAVLAGLIGVIVVLRPGSAELSLGHLAALSGAVFSALTSVIVRKIGREERTVVLMLYPMALNFLAMGALLPLVYEPMPLMHVGFIALVSVFGFAAGICLIIAYRHAEAAIVAPMQYSQMLWATGFGALLFDERIDRPTLIGAGIIILSGLYIVFRESQGGQSRTTPVLRTRSRSATSVSFRVSPMLRRWRERGE